MARTHLFSPLLLLLFSAATQADVLSGQIVDELGVGVADVQIEVENLAGPDPVVMNLSLIHI